MPQPTTIGKLRLRKIMPEGFKDIEKPLNSKELTNVMTEMAKSVPRSTYVETLKKLTNFGHEVANDYGGIASIHLKDVAIPPRLAKMRQMLERKVYQIAQREDLDSETKKKTIISVVKEATPIIDAAVMEELKDSGNSFGLLVGTGVKGKPQQLRQLIFGDLLTVDSKMRDIPYPTFRSYGEGVTPLQYWTASHGGRYGYIQVQKATADAGYFSKQTRGVVHRQLITMDDCGKARGYSVDADDSDNIGSLLYRDTKGKSGKVYPKDTILTEDILDDLDGRILVRSAITCGAGDGLCSKCAGVRESGRLPDIGEAVGLNGINALNEPLQQSGLCLHEDTLVLMADWTSKAIKDIKPGEWVLASNKYGRVRSTKVVAVHNNGIKPLYKYTARKIGSTRSISVIATKEHKILKLDVGAADSEIVPISEKTDNKWIICGDRWTEMANQLSEEYVGEFNTYDLEIDTDDHLFVLSNGAVVSNSSKHAGGESVSAKRVKRGFAAVDQFINMPENFVGGAAVSPEDGKVSDISKAPQGGTNIKIGNSVVYVPPGFEPTVKVGSHVEAGDLVSDGMVNIEAITKYKGLGAGRKAFVDAFSELLKDNGLATPKKQLEPFARAYLDRVEITDPDGLQGWIYGDIAQYNVLEKSWKPRTNSVDVKPTAAVGKYLEKPVLHYTIGTRITPSVAKDMTDNGVDYVTANEKEPPLKPYITSAKQFNMKDPDWVTALSGEGLTKSFVEHLQRGSISRKTGTSYYPALAFAGTGDEKQLEL